MIIMTIGLMEEILDFLNNTLYCFNNEEIYKNDGSVNVKNRIEEVVAMMKGVEELKTWLRNMEIKIK